MRVRTWAAWGVVVSGLGIGWLLTHGDEWPLRIVMAGVGGLCGLPFGLALAAPRAGHCAIDFAESSAFGDHYPGDPGSLLTDLWRGEAGVYSTLRPDLPPDEHMFDPGRLD